MAARACLNNTEPTTTSSPSLSKGLNPEPSTFRVTAPEDRSAGSTLQTGERPNQTLSLVQAKWKTSTTFEPLSDGLIEPKPATRDKVKVNLLIGLIAVTSFVFILLFAIVCVLPSLRQRPKNTNGFIEKLGEFPVQVVRFHARLEILIYRKTPLISTYVFSGLATEQVLIFGAVLTFGGYDKAEAKILQGKSLFNPVLSTHNTLLWMFQRLCTYFQDTGVLIFGGLYFRGIATNSKFQ